MQQPQRPGLVRRFHGQDGIAGLDEELQALGIHGHEGSNARVVPVSRRCRAQKIDFATAAAGGDNHAFASAELHLPRGQIGHADDQPANQIGRLINALDAGQHSATVTAAQTEDEFQQLLCPRHVLGRDHPGHAQIDLGKLIETDGLGNRLGQQRLIAVERQGFAGRRAFTRLGAGGDHGLDPFRIDPLHHMRKLAHRRAQQRPLRLLPVRDRIMQQLAGLLGQPRQGRRQVNRKLAKQVQADGAHVLKQLRVARILGEAPRRLLSINWLARSLAARMWRTARA